MAKNIILSCETLNLSTCIFPPTLSFKCAFLLSPLICLLSSSDSSCTCALRWGHVKVIQKDVNPSFSFLLCFLQNFLLQTFFYHQVLSLSYAPSPHNLQNCKIPIPAQFFKIPDFPFKATDFLLWVGQLAEKARGKKQQLTLNNNNSNKKQ